MGNTNPICSTKEVVEYVLSLIHISSVGEQAGNIAYTCFYTTKSYMDENPEIIQKFTNAIYKGQLWVQQHTSEEIADSISSFFPGTDKDVIVKVIDNYKSIDAFSDTHEVSEDGLNKLMDIIQGYDSSLIQTRPDFNAVSYTHLIIFISSFSN